MTSEKKIIPRRKWQGKFIYALVVHRLVFLSLTISAPYPSLSPIGKKNSFVAGPRSGRGEDLATKGVFLTISPPYPSLSPIGKPPKKNSFVAGPRSGRGEGLATKGVFSLVDTRGVGGGKVLSDLATNRIPFSSFP